MEETWKPKHNQWAIAMTVTLATFMEVMDTSIANVAIPHIAGGLGQSQDEATWVITSYLVSNAVILPISAYLTTIIGRKRFYMICVALFATSSLLCGFAPSLPILLFFRVLQGVGGGGLAPSEQAILTDTFPPEQRGKAFALYGFAVVTAPAIGPSLGGWITDNYNWRWIFFINIPIAILSLFLTNRLIEDPPRFKREVEETRKAGLHLDYLGFGLIALAFGSLEVILDKGQEDDWFGSHFITTFFILFLVGLVSAVIWELRQIRVKKRPVLDLRLFLNPNLSISFLVMMTMGFVLYGTTLLIPQLLQTLMGYTAEKAGMTVSLGGLATVIGMPLVGVLITKLDARYLMALGLITTGVGCIAMSNLDLLMSFSVISKLRFFQMAGVAFLFVPVNVLGYVGVAPDKSNDVSGLLNLGRNVGGSLGTSFVNSIYARHQQTHQTFLVAHAQSSNPAYSARIATMTQQALATVGSQADAQRHALTQFYQQLGLQASVLAYIDVLQYIGVGVLAVTLLTFFLKKAPKGASAAA